MGGVSPLSVLASGTPLGQLRPQAGRKAEQESRFALNPAFIPFHQASLALPASLLSFQLMPFLALINGLAVKATAR